MERTKRTESITIKVTEETKDRFKHLRINSRYNGCGFIEHLLDLYEKEMESENNDK